MKPTQISNDFQLHHDGSSLVTNGDCGRGKNRPLCDVKMISAKDSPSLASCFRSIQPLTGMPIERGQKLPLLMEARGVTSTLGDRGAGDSFADAAHPPRRPISARSSHVRHRLLVGDREQRMPVRDIQRPVGEYRRGVNVARK